MEHGACDSKSSEERSLKRRSKLFTPTNIGIAAAGLTAVTAIVVVPILCSTRVIDKTVKADGSSWFTNYILCPFNSYTCDPKENVEDVATKCGPKTGDGSKCEAPTEDGGKSYCAAGAVEPPVTTAPPVVTTADPPVST